MVTLLINFDIQCEFRLHGLLFIYNLGFVLIIIMWADHSGRAV
jgi:hypothetical protein